MTENDTPKVGSILQLVQAGGYTDVVVVVATSNTSICVKLNDTGSTLKCLHRSDDGAWTDGVNQKFPFTLQHATVNDWLRCRIAGPTTTEEQCLHELEAYRQTGKTVYE
jgi:surface antigen